MIHYLQKLRANMSVKLHYLHSQSLGGESEDQRERFHRTIRVIEERYMGKRDRHMMGCCWRPP